MVRMFITKHLGYKIDSDSRHIPIRTFGYDATKIERNMIMEKKYFANLEYREVNGVLVLDIDHRKNTKVVRAKLQVKQNVRYSLMDFSLG